LSSGFLGAIDSYAYRSPASQLPGETLSDAEMPSHEAPVKSVRFESITAGSGTVEHANAQ
jgi:hypothetical protein